MDETARAKGGRPRSEQARTAVLHAVDDLLVESGYAAMTMKSIAERAGVSRMTVYRWWSTKAEILFEASVIDAQQELAITPTGEPADDVAAYLTALLRFLTLSPAGAAYRALLGEAQHDTAVTALIASKDVIADSARTLLEGLAVPLGIESAGLDRAAALLVGPAFFWIMSGHDAAGLEVRDLADAFLAAAQSPQRR